MKKIFYALLALCGIGFSIFMIYRGKQQPHSPLVFFAPPEPPYKHYVAGEGLIESLDENTYIGTPFPELISNVYVESGQKVKKGDPLFKLDTRQLKASLCTEEAKLAAAQNRLARTTLTFSYYEKLQNKSAVSLKEYSEAYYAKIQAAENVGIALANIQEIQTHITRSTICAPSNGIILQQNTRVGEIANLNPFNNIPLMIFGNTSKVQLQVNIAEEDAWRVTSGAAATAYVRGNSDIVIPLTFDSIEPLIIQKVQLTGSDVERVDTRVLQIVYTFDKSPYPIYVGQLLDVYLEAKPSKNL
ncbi:MAG: efflux RND transporter periplasmic adaptor subunit [Candidatus Dependentiae bacterium]|nr:efflux RND transporter periplasmic adaptor subunit [Candidatus Dependentiae bacterium]